MNAPDFAGVLRTHRLRGRMNSDTEADCTCGEWSGDLTEGPFDAHVAAALDAEMVAWLGSEAATLRNYDGAVMTNERWGEGFLAGIDYAADHLAALAQAGGGEGE